MLTASCKSRVRSSGPLPLRMQRPPPTPAICTPMGLGQGDPQPPVMSPVLPSGPGVTESFLPARDLLPRTGSEALGASVKAGRVTSRPCACAAA